MAKSLIWSFTLYEVLKIKFRLEYILSSFIKRRVLHVHNVIKYTRKKSKKTSKLCAFEYINVKAKKWARNTNKTKKTHSFLNLNNFHLI